VSAAFLLQAASAPRAAATATPVDSAIGAPNTVAMTFFFAFIAITLGITYWAARRTRTAEHFYAAGRTVSAGQNGFALAGDYMSAASFLGIAGSSPPRASMDSSTPPAGSWAGRWCCF